MPAIQPSPGPKSPTPALLRVTTPVPRDRRIVDLATVATYLSVNERYIRRLVAERDVPFVKVRRLLRFDLDVIDRWIDERRHGEDNLRPWPNRDQAMRRNRPRVG